MLVGIVFLAGYITLYARREITKDEIKIAIEEEYQKQRKVEISPAIEQTIDQILDGIDEELKAA